VSSIDDAFTRWLAKVDRSVVGPHPEHILDVLRATFRAGWSARERMRAAEGEQAGLPLVLEPEGPAWCPSSGSGPTRYTSAEAASLVAGETAVMIRKHVLAEIRLRPSTDQEISRALQISENTVRPRRIELRDRGLVESIGKRKTQSGRSANVWAATDLARGHA